MWIVIAIAAAAFQTLRFMLQKKLSMEALSAGGATLSRFLFSAPFVLLLTAIYLLANDQALPALRPGFLPFALFGALAQILGTWCMVALFAERHFAVGITFKKTEVMQTALVGFLVLGDVISLPGFVAILLGLIGVVVLSKRPDGAGGLRGWVLNRGAGLGLMAGALFALSAVGYRGATLQVDHPEALMRALLSLAVATSFQTLITGAWILWREPGQMGKVLASWRSSLWVGLASLGGSLGWFFAFALQNAAYVFAVGQVEVIFSILIGVQVFGETLSRREGVGIALITLSVMALVAFH